MQNLTIFTEKSKEKPTINSNTLANVLNTRFNDINKSTSNLNKYVSTSHQFLGIYIAKVLNDFKNLPMYIKLAKYQDKVLLDAALSYVKDYPNPKSKRNLFLWYLKGKIRKLNPDSSLLSKKKRKIKPLNIFKYKQKK